MPTSNEQAKAKALARFADSGPEHINCAQTVAAFALQVRGHDPDLVVDARYFGGGITGMGEACGAITGAALALGLRDLYLPGQGTDRRDVTTDALKALQRDFAGEFGACRCRDLTGHDLSTPEGFKAFHDSEARDRCQGYVGWVCDRIAPLLAATEPPTETKAPGTVEDPKPGDAA